MTRKDRHDRTCEAYGNYQPPYEDCTCGFDDEWDNAKVEGFVDKSTCSDCGYDLFLRSKDGPYYCAKCKAIQI